MSKEVVVSRDVYIRNTSQEMLDNRQVDFVISSEAVDSYKTVFKMDGWDLNRYVKNPIVCYQHRSHSDNPDDIIGTSEVFMEADELIARVTFESGDFNEKAEKVFQKVVAGTLKMASVGARVMKSRFGDEKKGEDPSVLYFTRQQLIEWSIVSVGSNPDAHKREEKTITDLRAEALKELPVESTEINVKRSLREAELLID